LHKWKLPSAIIDPVPLLTKKKNKKISPWFSPALREQSIRAQTSVDAFVMRVVSKLHKLEISPQADV